MSHLRPVLAFIVFNFFFLFFEEAFFPLSMSIDKGHTKVFLVVIKKRLNMFLVPINTSIFYFNFSKKFLQLLVS